jgi:ribosomal protein S1
MDTMARMNKISFDDISFNELEEFLKEKLKKAMNAAHEIFGENAFRRAYGGIYSGRIADSLFEVWGVHLGQLSDDEISKLIEKKEYLVNEFRKLLNDERLVAAILWESEKVKMVQFRFDQVRKLITETLLVKDPWENIEENYPIGETVKGTVVRIYRAGTFVELEKGLEGLIQSSEVSWTNQYPNPHNFFREGDLIDVVVLEINWMERFILLSYKQSKPDPWKLAAEKYSVGSIVQGKIVRFFSFGAFAELEDDVDGLISISELDTRWVENPEDVVSIGDELKLKVIDLDINTRKIALSLKEGRGKQPRRRKKRPSQRSR